MPNMKSTPLIAQILRLQCATAIRLSQIACLGFLGFLASLGFIHGWERMFGFSGFFGFFGFIGIAVLVEAISRRRQRNLH
jgi:hypothetical protein